MAAAAAAHSSGARLLRLMDASLGALAHKAVERRVGHTVEAGEQKWEVVVVEDPFDELTVPLQPGSHQQEDVVRREAHQKDENGAGHKVLDTRLLRRLRTGALAYRTQHAEVRHGQDYQWKEEAHEEAVVVHRVFPGLHGIVLEAHLLHRPVHTDPPVIEEDGPHSQLLEPDEGAYQPGRSHGAERGEAEGVDHGQVAVDGDAAEEANGDVDVLVEQDTT